MLSKALGSRTVLSGSISRGKNDPSQSLQMMERPLLTSDELKSLPKGQFVLMKTGVHPMRTKLRLFLDWGIYFDKAYITEEKSNRKVYYADKQILEENILKEFSSLNITHIPPETNEPNESVKTKGGGVNHVVNIEPNRRINPKKNMEFKP